MVRVPYPCSYPLLFPVIPPLIPPPRLQFRDCLSGIHNLLGAKEGDDVGAPLLPLYFLADISSVSSASSSLFSPKKARYPRQRRRRREGMQREETGSRRRRRRVINRSFVRCPPSLPPSLPFPPFLPLKTGCWVQAERETQGTFPVIASSSSVSIWLRRRRRRRHTFIPSLLFSRKRASRLLHRSPPPLVTLPALTIVSVGGRGKSRIKKVWEGGKEENKRDGKGRKKEEALTHDSK